MSEKQHHIPSFLTICMQPALRTTLQLFASACHAPVSVARSPQDSVGSFAENPWIETRHRDWRPHLCALKGLERRLQGRASQNAPSHASTSASSRYTLVYYQPGGCRQQHAMQCDVPAGHLYRKRIDDTHADCSAAVKSEPSAAASCPGAIEWTCCVAIHVPSSPYPRPTGEVQFCRACLMTLYQWCSGAAGNCLEECQMP